MGINNVRWIILILLTAGMLPSAQVINIAEGDPIRLDCTALFQSNRRMRWFAGGHATPPAYHILQYYEVTPGNWVTRMSPGTKYTDRIDHSTQGVCVISPSRKDDDTQYFCDVAAEPDPIKRSFIFTIRPISPPTQPPTVTPGPVRSQESSAVQLTCQLLEDTGEPFTYSWSRSNGEVKGQVDPIQGTLTFSATVRGDQDTYTCRASNRAGHTEAFIQLFVDYLPTIFNITTHKTADILYSGDKKEMMCRTEGGRPLPTLIWNCLGQMGSPGGTGNIKTISFTAEVKPNWHNQGCVCIATQEIPAMTQTRSVTFDVYWPPTLPSLSFIPTLPWVEGNTYSATCHLSNVGNPACTYSWSKNGQKLPHGTTNISLPVTKNDHNKEIKCEVQNQHTQNRPPQQPLEAKQNLDVQFAPRVSISPDQSEITKKEDDNLTLDCSSESNPVAQDQHYKWIHQRGGSTVRERQGQKTWVLGPVKKETAGTYSCEVSVPIYHHVSITLTGRRQTTLIVQYPSPSGGLNAGAIAGGVIGVLLVTAIITVLVWIFIRRRRRKSNETGNCQASNGDKDTETRTPEQAYEFLNRPTDYENVKMSNIGKDETYQELQKQAEYDNVERKDNLQEQAYEKIPSTTNPGSMCAGKQITINEKLQ